MHQTHEVQASIWHIRKQETNINPDKNATIPKFCTKIIANSWGSYMVIYAPFFQIICLWCRAHSYPYPRFMAKNSDLSFGPHFFANVQILVSDHWLWIVIDPFFSDLWLDWNVNFYPDRGVCAWLEGGGGGLKEDVASARYNSWQLGGWHHFLTCILPLILTRNDMSTTSDIFSSLFRYIVL